MVSPRVQNDGTSGISAVEIGIERRPESRPQHDPTARGNIHGGGMESFVDPVAEALLRRAAWDQSTEHDFGCYVGIPAAPQAFV